MVLGLPATRAEIAAEEIAGWAREVGAGARIGSRDDLRARCGVSVGTLHEALRLLQSTGEIVVRTGPGGGVFAGTNTELARLLRSVVGPSASQPSFAEASRVLSALSPLIFADAAAAADDALAERLLERFDALVDTRGSSIRAVAAASLEVFATVMGAPSPGLLQTVTAGILRAQVSTLRDVALHVPASGEWEEVVDRHIEAVRRLVDAILAGDAEAARAVRDDPGFLRLFWLIDDATSHPATSRFDVFGASGAVG